MPSLPLLLIFAVLMFLFKEWLISFLVLFISVMGITGCILAIAVIGGFVAGLPLLLVVLPSLMRLLYKKIL